MVAGSQVMVADVADTDKTPAGWTTNCSPPTTNEADVTTWDSTATVESLVVDGLVGPTAIDGAACAAAPI